MEATENISDGDFHRRVRDALSFAQRQVRRLIETHPGLYPLYTDGGRWKHDKPAWTHWCDGFLPGMMWLFLESGLAEDAAFWRSKAEEYSKQLEHRKEDRDVHDLGFIFYHGTYRRWYELDAHPELKQVVVRAGRVLAMRFQEKGEYLRSFVAEESLFIDIMMNVPIIFYAAIETGDEQLRSIAMRHCLTTRRVLVRGDGSTAHEGIFDTTTGEFLRQSTHQGFRGDSCWSRGLAWSIYGFGTCFRLTHDARFLETAIANAEFYLANTPRGVPPWDYDARDRSQPDSSAAAIAAVGLMNLAALANEGKYLFAAREILETLLRPPYLVMNDPEWEGILRCGVYHMHKNLGIDESVMWGDFFFVEALVKALQLLIPSPGTPGEG